jgi:serine/threonine protein kinase
LKEAIMLREGTILQQNRYRIMYLLGRGGMGAVYAARHLGLEISVAIKELTAQADLDPEILAQLRTQFKREAMTLARLNHNNLVRVLDSFEENGNAYLVMEMVEGESLADRIGREGALAAPLVLRWAHQLLDALAYCHGQNVLHRDIKPTNIIIRPDEQAVLVDFGLVKLWDPRDPRTMTVVRGMGTPEYAPPEQYEAESGSTDVRSDIYGLGATLYHALVGQAPPTATKRIVNPAALIPVCALNPNIDPAIEAALMRALELRPIDRFQNAREMASALGTGSLYASAAHYVSQHPPAGPPLPQSQSQKTAPPSRAHSVPITKPPTAPPVQQTPRQAPLQMRQQSAPPVRQQSAQSVQQRNAQTVRQPTMQPIRQPTAQPVRQPTPQPAQQQMQQPMPQYLPPQPRPRQERAAASIAAFILGVIGLGSTFLVPICSLPLPLVGIVVSILGIRSKKRRGLAWAGLALCLLTLGLTLLLVLIGAVQEFGNF